jgi:hypothetical protein
MFPRDDKVSSRLEGLFPLAGGKLSPAGGSVEVFGDRRNLPR